IDKKNRANIEANNILIVPAVSNIPNVYSAFYERRLIRLPSQPRRERRMKNEKPNFESIKQLLNEIDSIGSNPDEWKANAPRIRRGFEGKEMELVRMIKTHGEELTHELGRMIETGNQHGVPSLLKGSLL